MSVGGYLFYVKEGEASLEECEEFFIKDIYHYAICARSYDVIIEAHFKLC